MLQMFEILAELVVEDELREVRALELRVFQSLVVRLVLADLSQLVQVVLDADSLLDQLKTFSFETIPRNEWLIDGL